DYQTSGSYNLHIAMVIPGDGQGSYTANSGNVDDPSGCSVSSKNCIHPQSSGDSVVFSVPNTTDNHGNPVYGVAVSDRSNDTGFFLHLANYLTFCLPAPNITVSTGGVNITSHWATNYIDSSLLYEGQCSNTYKQTSWAAYRDKSVGYVTPPTPLNQSTATGFMNQLSANNNLICWYPTSAGYFNQFVGSPDAY
ncbi:MAG: hypothetical protein ACK4PR_00995, partial [Gammaproteobacteria bacterium]